MFKFLSSIVFVLVFSGSTLAANASTPSTSNSAKAAIAATVDSPPAARQSFASWRSALRAEAINLGVSPALFEQAFAGLTPDPQVIAADQSQPEFSRPVWEYLDSAVSSWRVARGKALLAEHTRTLNAIEERYRVDPSILVAVWGLESSFGRQTGDKSVIRSLATLAYEGRRNDFWRSQLIAALQILQEGDISVNAMQGSWAGAMGQTQFIPSTYRQYAVDFDGNGRRDIWNSSADALASAANYLHLSGWQHQQPWGLEVQLPAQGFDYALADGQTRKTISQWRALGITSRDTTTHLDKLGDQSASLFLPSGHQGPAYLLLSNFRSILKYNNSTSYALAIGLLADALQGNYRIPSAWPKHDRMLSRTERVELQTLLNQLGFESGHPDGIIGVNTRQAVRGFQQAQGMPADGYSNESLLNSLRRAVRSSN